MKRTIYFVVVLVVSCFSPVFATAQEGISHRDIVYGHTDGMAMVYDVAVPGNANGAGIVFVVSGGFLSSVQQQQMISPVVAPLYETGFTIFYLRHPSTPRYLAPEIYDALKVGMAHILENSSMFDVNPSRIGTMGMSTGGLLSLLLAVDQPEALDLADGARPAASVAYMPITDIRPQVGNVQATPSLDFDPELAPQLSPIDFVSTDDPPVLFIHGNQDQIVDPEESARMHGRLVSASVATELLTVDAGHELFSGETKEAADNAAVRWFTEHLSE